MAKSVSALSDLRIEAFFRKPVSSLERHPGTYLQGQWIKRGLGGITSLGTPLSHFLRVKRDTEHLWKWKALNSRVKWGESA